MNSQNEIKSNLGPVPLTKKLIQGTGPVRAFTLVELIVVITILAILWTIGFISLQWFSRDARDSARISDLKSIEKWFEILLTTDQSLPQPEDYVEITASWTTISYQWYAWLKVMWTARVFWDWKDPLDDTYYTYVTDTGFRNYQLMWFLENWDQISLYKNILNKTQAIDYSNRYPIVKWKPLWIIVDSITKEPLQVTWAWIDIVNTVNEYEVYLNKNYSVTWSWNALFSKIYNWSKIYLNNKELAKFDNNLVWYWDMETKNNSSDLADLTLNWYHLLNRGSVNIWNKVLTYWNATSFNWTSNYFNKNNLYSKIFLNDKFTLSAWVNPSSYHTVSYYWLKNIVFSKWAGSTYNYAIQISNKNTVSFIKRNSDEHLRFTDFTWIDDLTNKWTNISMVIDNGYVSLFIDWKFYESKAILEIISSESDSFYIWWSSVDEMKFIWDIDDIRIYNRVLSEKELENLYYSMY